METKSKQILKFCPEHYTVTCLCSNTGKTQHAHIIKKNKDFATNHGFWDCDGLTFSNFKKFCLKMTLVCIPHLKSVQQNSLYLKKIDEVKPPKFLQSFNVSKTPEQLCIANSSNVLLVSGSALMLLKHPEINTNLQQLSLKNSHTHKHTARQVSTIS